MSSPDPTAPEGWYDDAKLLGIKRYWDGSARTDRTSAVGDLDTGDLDRLDHRALRVWQIVAGIAVLVAVIAVVFALAKPAEVRVVQAPTPAPTASQITIPAGDYSDFVESATGDLDDFDKDLDDVETTIDDGGYWRLFSNTAELRFNLEQLRTATAPGFLAAEWDDALDDLDDSLQDLAASIDKKQTAQRDALEATRDVSAEARALVALLAD